MNRITGLCLVTLITGSVASAQMMTLVPRGGVGNELSVAPGGLVTIDVYVEDVVNEQVRGYQVTVSAAASGGAAGTMTHDGSTPLIDEGHPDYIFAGLPASGIGSVQSGPQIVNALESSVDSVTVTGAKYCGEFVFVASPDASGDFTIDIAGAGTNPATSESFIVNENNTPLAFATTPAVVHILPLMTLLPRGGSGNGITIASCESVTIDVFIQSSAPTAIRGYQTTLSASASGGLAGTLDHDGTPPVIDASNPDYIFAGLSASGGSAVNPPLIVNALDSAADSVAVTAPRYAGEFVYTASSDAEGEFVIEIVDPGTEPGTSQSFIADQDNAAISFAPAVAIIVVNGGSGCIAAGDCDQDGDVDVFDFENLANCQLGPGGGVGTGCSCFDLDGDGDVTMADFAVFQRSFSSN